ncbi:MAG: YidC/Oxa1 family membrane protein insertase [Patescibacteria group bacterium]
MFSSIYHTAVFNPLYNGLILLFDTFPWMDAGIVVIIFTIIIRLILFPLSKKAIVTQVRMKEIEPELNNLKKTVTDKQQQALKVMELYKTKGVNPFSSFFLLFLQLPIIYALYSIFIRSGLPEVNTELLYGFISVPTINMHFLGLIDISQKSYLFAILAAVAQFLQLHFSLAASNTGAAKSDNPSVDMAQNMMKNMKYVFPIIVFFISYKISAVVAIYWTISSLFTLGQELVVKRHLKKHQPL